MDVVPSISSRVTDLGEYLREQRESARLSVRQLATLAGVSNPYLSQVERGLRHPSAEVLQQIARGLRISAEALYVRAGILDENLRVGVEQAVGADPDLSERQKRVLLDIYASFVAENARAAAEDVAAAVPRRRPSTRTTSSVPRKRPARTPRVRAAAEDDGPEAPATTAGAVDAAAPEAGRAAASDTASGTAAGARPRKRATGRATPRAAKRPSKRAAKAAPPAPETDTDAAPDAR